MNRCTVRRPSKVLVNQTEGGSQGIPHQGSISRRRCACLCSLQISINIAAGHADHADHPIRQPPISHADDACFSPAVVSDRIIDGPAIPETTSTIGPSTPFSAFRHFSAISQQHPTQTRPRPRCRLGFRLQYPSRNHGRLWDRVRERLHQLLAGLGTSGALPERAIVCLPSTNARPCTSSSRPAATSTFARLTRST